VADPDPAVLLALYRPTVQYDSLESYYTDWAAVITDRPSNVLKRADGTVLAAAGPPTGNAPVLNLAFLAPQTYPTGQPVNASDFIGETGSDYVTQARAMHALPGYANKAHGRIVEQGGATWLQYWLFMYYDDPGFLGLGTHEGDIEMIQLLLNATGQPDVVTYAQHRSGLTATWDQVETVGDSPVVYSARGTHASMLRSGDLVSDRSLIPDHNDAQGPRAQLDLIALSQAQTPWAFWPGSWGGTKAQDGILGTVGVEANSPTAPNRHQAWGDPNGFHQSCEAADVPPVGAASVAAGRPQPAAPSVAVTLDAGAGAARVTYTTATPPGAPPPASLVIGLDSSGGTLPPATTVVPLHGESGELEARIPAGVTSVSVRATTHAADGTASATAVAHS